MFLRLSLLTLSLAVARSAYVESLSGQTAPQFPAGLDPAACPNYPVCDNPSVAVNQVPASPYAQYNPAQVQYTPQQYQQPQARYTQPQQQYTPQYNPSPVPVQQYNSLPQYNHQNALQLQQRQYNFAPQQYVAAPQAQYDGVQGKQQQYAPHIQAALDRGEYIGDGDYHDESAVGAGDQGRVVPTYARIAAPQQAAYAPIPQQAAYAAPQGYAPQQGHIQHLGQARLPAGLAPGACPNYPFCQQ